MRDRLQCSVRRPTTDDLPARPRFYRDTGGVNDQSDQFLRWINAEGTAFGIWVVSGQSSSSTFDSCIATAVILVTHGLSGSVCSEPWEDMVDRRSGRIVYWGDAKYHGDEWSTVGRQQRHYVKRSTGCSRRDQTRNCPQSFISQNGRYLRLTDCAY